MLINPLEHEQNKCQGAQFKMLQKNIMSICTGKSFSDVLILASTNPQYDKRLFVELHENCKLRTCYVHKLFFAFVLTFRTIYVHMFWLCSELAIFMYWTRNSMNNLSSYYGLVDAKIGASDQRFTCMYKQEWKFVITKEFHIIWIMSEDLVEKISINNHKYDIT